MSLSAHFGHRMTVSGDNYRTVEMKPEELRKLPRYTHRRRKRSKMKLLLRGKEGENVPPSGIREKQRNRMVHSDSSILRSSPKRSPLAEENKRGEDTAGIPRRNSCGTLLDRSRTIVKDAQKKMSSLDARLEELEALSAGFSTGTSASPPPRNSPDIVGQIGQVRRSSVEDSDAGG
mmetsp:Transcript_4211/g.8100  ORF Transcript_4211/g.8100 Transcript_4211/m.8100 type:complete len:176 (+) Transcript_4211:42-569(+)